MLYALDCASTACRYNSVGIRSAQLSVYHLTEMCRLVSCVTCESGTKFAVLLIVESAESTESSESATIRHTNYY